MEIQSDIFRFEIHWQQKHFMQNEQNEVWTTPDFEAIPTNMECTAYSETL